MSQARDRSHHTDETEIVGGNVNREIDVDATRASNPPDRNGIAEPPTGDEHATGGTDPREPMATLKHLSDSLIGETVTLASSDAALIGNFRLTSRLGAGGFGIVYAADDLRLDRRVALKVPFAVKGEAAAEYYKRVFHEGRAAAALDHPNIVSIYDVAERNGQPFIVSQLIVGPSLYDRTTSGRMDQHEASKLMVLIARALAYAHKKRIIHRDLKPGNILLDEDGVPYVNDFGIAKYESVEETISTEDSVIGTPAYMSPEQAAGHSRNADRRSDLYSLGVILYELITGERPFRGSSRMLLHQVMHDDPQPPRQLVYSIHRDLETICLKCLEKDPARRYQDCNELADELERFIAGDAIKARPVSRIEHAWRKCRRHPVATALGMAFLISLFGGLAGVTWQWRRAESNRVKEQFARREAENSREELANEVEYSNRLLYGARMQLAANSVTSGDFRQAKNHLSLSKDGLMKYRDIEYSILRNLVDRNETLLQHIEQVTDVAISDDESIIAACGLRTLLVWDVESGHVVYRYREKGKQLRCVAFAPQSDLLAWSGQSGRIAFLSTKTPGRSHASLDHGSGVRAIAFSDDGSMILSAGDDGKIVIWSVETKKQIQVINPHKGKVRAAEFVDSLRVISGGEDGRVCLNHLETGKISVLSAGARPVAAVAASADGKSFAAGFEDTRVVVGEFDNAKDVKLIDLPGTYAVDLEFLLEPEALTVSTLAGSISVWDFPDVGAARIFSCVQGFGHFAFAANSQRLILGAGDGAIQSIQLKDAIIDEISVECTSLNDATIIDDAQAIVVCPDRGPANVIHLASGRVLRNIPDYSDLSIPASLRQRKILSVDESSDGKKLAFGTDSGQVLIWQVADAKLRVLGSAGGRGITRVRLIGDGSKLVSGGEDGAVRVWELARANDSTELTRHGGVIRGLELSPDGKWLVAVAADGSATLLDTATWSEKTRLETGRVLHCAAWSSDSTRLALGDSKGTVLIYPSDLSGDPRQLSGHTGPISGIVFSPSGETMISGGNEDGIRFWDLQTGQIKMVTMAHDRKLRSISISRDGSMLMSADVAGTVRIWPAKVQAPLE